MDEEAESSLNDKTRESERRSSERQAGADREATPEEAELADRAADELVESGELDQAREHEQEMNRIGAEVKGEGQIP